MTEFVAELLGTMVLITFGVGVVGGVLLKWSKAEEAGWIVITLGWGLAVTMGIYVSGIASDAHLNPAVTLGFSAIGDFPWRKVDRKSTRLNSSHVASSYAVFCLKKNI